MKDLALFDRIVRFKEIDSTIEQSSEIIRNTHRKSNFLVLADQQSSGRGRKGNFWHSPEGGLWLTAALADIHPPAGFTLYCGICMHKALIEVVPQLQGRLMLKWPNDIYLDGKKLGGIIVNAYPASGYHLISMGINTNVETVPDELKDKATSLLLSISRKINNQTLLDAFFEQYQSQGAHFFLQGLQPYIAYYRKHCLLFNRQISIVRDTTYTGKMVGIDADGALLLQTETEVIRIISGTVVAID